MYGPADCSARSFYCLALGWLHRMGGHQAPDSIFPTLPNSTSRRGGSSISFLQQPMLYFAQGVFRERIHRDEIDGNLVRTEPSGRILIQCFCQLWRHRAVHHDVGHHLFTIDGIGPADDGGLADGGIGFKHLFDLAWRNVFAPSDNDIAQTTRDIQVALFVLVADITCAKPTLLKRFFVRVAIVGGNDAGATDANLTCLTARHIVQTVIPINVWAADTQRDTHRQAG